MTEQISCIVCGTRKVEEFLDLGAFALANKFLSKEELEQMTGFKRPSGQCQWLASHGYRFEVNALGYPVVLSSAVEQKLRPCARSSRQPNFEALTNG